MQHTWRQRRPFQFAVAVIVHFGVRFPLFPPSIPRSFSLSVCLSVFLGPVMSTVRPHLYMYIDVCVCVCAPRAERSVNSIIFIFHLSFKLSRVVVVVTVALVVVNSM